MVILQLAIVLAAIFLGARLGSIGIGYAGGLGVLVLALMGVKPGSIPIDVILVIMSVIAAIGAMQVAGGIDFLVVITEKFLRKHPKYITYLAPIVTYFMTLMAGTGHTAFSTLPVIAEVAKEQGVRPSRPLSIAVVSSQIAITASPISAAVVFFSGVLEKEGIPVGYLDILMICIPTTLLAVILTSFLANFLGKELKDDPVYLDRLAKGLVVMRGVSNIKVTPMGKRSVWIFLFAIVVVMLYATLISDKVGLFGDVSKGAWFPKESIPMIRDHAIYVIMLSAATAITFFCRIDAANVLSASTFKSGMSACVCILGVAWLGTTFVGAHEAGIKELSEGVLRTQPWLLAVALFFASMLLYSQAATARALMPLAITVGAAPVTLVASFAAVSALFVLPTYPTLLAAVEMDDTGSTRIGKYVFNHPFFIPGVVCIALAVLFGFMFAPIVL
ncbi:MAG: anaerobic C4-dicarboxylate transporter [Proteobacteria bacterium]|nr:anaerobic C4-dicarboxylate transporter [Pseudomonadota bacterium]MCL2307060.1 anaerobic C4-dicarboxylate transporter [Pseudomonadota bacterium]